MIELYTDTLMATMFNTTDNLLLAHQTFKLQHLADNKYLIEEVR